MTETLVKVGLVGIILLLILAGIGAALPKITAEQGSAIEAAFTWDLQTRNHADERHPEDQNMSDWCEQQPTKTVFYLVTKVDPRGDPVRYNELCTVFGPEGMITVVKPFVRNGGIFQLVTRYIHDMLVNEAQLEKFVTSHAAPGYQILLSEQQFMELVK